MLSLFFRFELGKIGKYFKTKTLAKSIITLLFLVVFAFVGFGVYFFFLSGLRFINVEAVEDIRSALTLFLYESFLIVLAGIVVFSSLLTGTFNLFKGGNNNWIISSPSFRSFPRWVLIKSLLNSLIISLIIFLPAILAFNRIYHFGILGLIFILLSIGLTLVIISTLSLIIILAIAYTYYKLSLVYKGLTFTLPRLLSFLVLGFVGIAYYAWRAMRDVDLVRLFKADEFDGSSLAVLNISEHFTMLPTHPLALLLLHFQNGETSQALMNFSLILISTIVLVVIWNKISCVFFLPWKKLQEGTAQTLFGMTSNESDRKLLTFSGGKTAALFKKEAVVSLRNMKGILWFMFLMLLWFAQIGTNIIMSKNIARYGLDVADKAAILQALQFIIAVYFMASFALRFVFPAFSVEKKTLWILGTAPISFKKIFFGKYLFYTLFFSFLGVFMSACSVMVLNLSFVYALYSIVLFLLTTIFIVTLALSLGALFPSLESDDPEVVSTSMSGLFFTACALIYGGISDFVLYYALTKGSIAPGVVFITVTCVLIALLLLKTPRAVAMRQI